MYHPGIVFLEGNQPSSTRFRFVRIILLLLALFFLFPDLTPEAHASHAILHARHAIAAAYSVSGTVFNDYNEDGTQSTTEPGLNGIVVTAYNAAGTVVTGATTSTISSVLGQYSLSIPSGTGPVRIQFSNFGSGSTIADLTGLQPSNHGSGTRVQFVSGTSSTNTINLGLERPAEYCQYQPTLVASCFVVGDQTTANQPVVYSFSSISSGTTPVPTSLASSTAMGSVLGLAYRRSSDSLFASAYMKRHAGFKPSGSTGAIYLVSGANSASPGTPSVFVDLGATTGGNPHQTANYTLDNSASDAYDQVGKISLGGMALSDDETTLYEMNLNDKKLYSIAVGAPPAAPVVGTISSTAVPVPASCASADLRPFAVTSYHGLIYVGAVCSAESTVTGPAPMGDPTKLQAYVFVYTPGSGFTSTPVFQTALNYSRHCANDANYADCTSSGSANLNVGNPAAWNPWHPGFTGYRDLGHSSGQQYTDYPQPMLSSIAFENGNLLLGLRDRYGDQTGNGQLTPDGSRTIYGVPAGDVLRACLNTAGTFSSGWTLESNGTCGGITTAGATNSRLGPGGGQYYYQNYYSPYYDNTATGSLLQIPGLSTVTTTFVDNAGNTSTGGVSSSSNATGALTPAYGGQTSSYQIHSSGASNFGRANGLGGLTALCQSAPIEIGNRVWADTNGNGIQDAGEPGIAGVTVHLYASDGTTLLKTTTTDTTGAYYFIISPYTSYIIKLDNASDYINGALQSFSLTIANQDSTNHLIDSKATLPTPTSPIGTGNYPTFSVGSHIPGQNDDSFGVGLIPPAVPYIAAYTVNGTVFDDYNQNGIQDNNTNIVEPGLNGIVVTAYNAAGTAVTSATTSTIASVLGQYSLAIPSGTGPVRVQFSNFGSGSTIADLTGLQSSNHGSGTSVQFVTGISSTNTVNLGLERPAEYCQNQPTLSTNCYLVGDQTTANKHVLVSFSSGATGTSPAPTALANSTDVGSTWGLAYRRSSDSLFASAYLKRHVGFKPSGSTGAIYLISGANSGSPGTPSLFVDLNVAVGAGTAGADPHDTANYTQDNSAADAYDQVGKVSLGGMAISDDETTLYVMNLSDKKLYAIAVGTPPATPVAGTINSTAVPVPSGCTSSDFRPFAVTSYHGLIYVGAVCSAESTVTGPLPLGDPTKLQAYVFVYTPGSGFTSTAIFQAALNYPRHCTNDTQYADCTAAGSANLNVGNPAAWNPWHPGFIGYRDLGHSASQTYTDYPQPMLSTIAFENGNLLLGLRDRFGDQAGNGQLTPDGTRTIYGVPAGDALRACLNTAGTFSSGWTLESNGTCGGITTAGASNTRLGPGGGQYYYQNYHSPNHDNTALGSVLQIPGAPSMITTTTDPVVNILTAGFRAASNTTGVLTSSYQVYGYSATNNFGKANGLGDLVALCQAAPIEIGNRVWADTNGNGIQDAGEPGISGVTVHLYSADGTTLLQTTTTDSTGAYYFTISAYTSYLIKLDNAADYANGGVLHSLLLTTANLDTINHLTDSKATLPNTGNAIGTGNYPTVSVAAHTPGQNDDTFDVGFTSSPSAYSVSGTVFDDYNEDGTQSATEPGINGVVVTAYNAAGAIVTSDTTSTATAVLGQYSLSIPAGTGPVRVQFSNFGSTSTIADLTGLQSSNHVGGTSVQFVSGASSTNTVNLGLERPAEYCQNQPTLSTNCYIFGDQTTASQHVLVSFPSSATGTTPAPTALADSTAIGSTWGLAYRRSSDSLFASAYLKRSSGFKPSGSTGAIYLISGADSGPHGTPSLFVDLNTATGGGSAGANPHDPANYGTDAAVGDTYDLIGKVSLGGMALSDDETTLYVMNLNDKKLYAIAVGTPPAAPVAGTISSTVVPVPSSCPSADFRPFAVTSYHGLIYVGAVCSAESTVTGSLPLGDPTKLQAYVFIYTPGSGFTSTPIFQTALNYSRHCANVGQSYSCTAAGSANLQVGSPAAWNPWHPGFIGYSVPGGFITVYPQPMLTSIAFDNGNLLLGLRDRFGDQSGYQSTLTPDGSSTLFGGTAGDMLRACLNTAGTFSSGWTLESNGTCGSITTAGANISRLGPGGGQYYYQYHYLFTISYHDNTEMGSVLQLPGSPSVTTTADDVLGNPNTGGIGSSSNTTGAETATYQVYSTSTSTFGKANGLGDLVAFCTAAPIEIGNRVWADTNGNGIQDAGEPGISGATVHLYAANGTTLLQTTTTNSNGEYYFTVPAYVGYVIKLDNATDYASGGVLHLFRLTIANQDTVNHVADSNATLPTPASPIGTNNYPTVSVVSHTPGQNDDTFDIGFVPPSDLAAGKTIMASGGNLARAANFTATSSYEGSGWGLAYVHDGILSSSSSSYGWTSNATLTSNHTEWIQWDMGTSSSIQAINLYPRNDGTNTGYGFPIDFTIATSTDGSTWNPLVTRTGYALPAGVQTFTFPTQTARYMRVTGTNLRSNPNDSNNYRMSFAEITVY